MAAAALGILLMALVTARFVRCFEASTLHRFPRQRMTSGSTSRKLAGGEQVELTSVYVHGDESETESITEALESCVHEVLLAYPSVREDVQSESAREEHDEEPSTWDKSPAAIVLFSIPVLLGLTSLILGVTTILLPKEGAGHIETEYGRDVSPTLEIITGKENGHVADTLPTSTATAANLHLTPGRITTVSGNTHGNVASVPPVTAERREEGAPPTTTVTTQTWQVTGGVSGSGSWDVTSFPSTPAQGVEQSASATTTVTTTASESGATEVATISSTPGWYGTDVSLTSTTGVSRDQYPSVTSVPPTTDKAGEAGAASTTTVATVDSGSETAGTTRVVSATKEEDVSTASGATSRISKQGAQRGTSPGATPTGDGTGSASSMSRVATTLGWNGTTKPTTIASTTRVDGATAAATSEVTSTFFRNGAQDETSVSSAPTVDGKAGAFSTTTVTTVLPGSETTGTAAVVSATGDGKDVSAASGVASTNPGRELSMNRVSHLREQRVWPGVHLRRRE
ncbi:hypothetical protein CSUI_010424 [Cystoisospora suis]|uniref:Transmembrane protein n=1 Tax=Cystoisospora suis TaxID=483139 RepID=A0A2C6KH01_9APIC|nr:hypothetical protein CSUI_010424 [Cystoisospora suis]